MSATHTTSSQHLHGGPMTGARPAVRAIVAVVRRPFNRFIVRFAGSRRLRAFAIVQHKGRRSGHVYSTPVAARPTDGGFIIPLTFGEGADWFQNLRAAGGGAVRWNGKEYQVMDPEVVDLETAQAAFGPVERRALRLLGITWFGRVRTSLV